MTTHIKDTIEFLKIARKTVCEGILLKLKEGTLTKKEATDVIDYFVNEATDYEVMHFIVREGFSEYSINKEDEVLVFEEFNKMIRSSYTQLSEHMTLDIIKTMVYDIKPISTHGIDTAAPYFNRLHESGALDILVEETPNLPAVVPPKKIAILKSNKPKPKFKLGKGGKAVTAVAIGVAVAFAARKIYANFLSKAARTCKGSANKKECMKKFKIQALKAKLNKIKAGMAECNKVQTPAGILTCKTLITDKMDTIKTKIKKLSK